MNGGQAGERILGAGEGLEPMVGAQLLLVTGGDAAFAQSLCSALTRRQKLARVYFVAAAMVQPGELLDPARLTSALVSQWGTYAVRRAGAAGALTPTFRYSTPRRNGHAAIVAMVADFDPDLAQGGAPGCGGLEVSLLAPSFNQRG